MIHHFDELLDYVTEGEDLSVAMFLTRIGNTTKIVSGNILLKWTQSNLFKDLTERTPTADGELIYSEAVEENVNVTITPASATGTGHLLISHFLVFYFAQFLLLVCQEIIQFLEREPKILFCQN